MGNSDKRMIVYFRLRQDHEPYQQVIASLARQTIPCEIIKVYNQGGTENTHRTYTPIRRMAEMKGCVDIFCRAVILGDEFFCSSDWDYEHLKDTNIAEMQSVFSDPVIGAVSIAKQYQTGIHVDIGFVMYRRNAVAKSDWQNLKNKYGSCSCLEVNELIRNAGYKFVRLDNLNRTREM
jgi:hypothetical protein